ncbi:ACP S-malonyltransferase [Nonomuraea sp. NPDC048916]|uniref:ACP S-malonyltransferase n=1 Tax=Nonomuraea sp. NPDC048916 TaxID=3154232 RepID=UPI0033FB3196
MQTDSREDSAIIFPGISPARFGETARFLLIDPVARRMLAEADEVLGYSLLDRYREAEGDYSEAARVAFLVSCLALAQWAGDTLGIRPRMVAGPSFGGIPAAVHSGALGFTDAVALTASWGRVVEEYFTREHRDVVTVSVARLPEERLARVLEELVGREEWYGTACFVDSDFHLVSVHESKVEWLQDRMRAEGGLPLSIMRPPMHSSRFGSLRETIERELFGDLSFAEPVIPVVSDHDGTVLTSGAQLRELVLDAVVRPVRWPVVVDTLRREGIRTLCVSGPDAMWGRVACTRKNFEVVAVKPKTALQPRRRSALV